MLSRLFYSGPPLHVLHAEYAARRRVDPDAQTFSSSTRVLDRPVEHVWRVLADVPAWSPWASNLKVLEFGGLHPGAAFRWRLNGLPLRSRFAVVDPLRELTWTGTFLAYKAVDRHVLEPLGENTTRITIEESLSGPLLPLVYNPRRLRANHERRLTDLAAAVTAEV